MLNLRDPTVVTDPTDFLVSHPNMVFAMQPVGTAIGADTGIASLAVQWRTLVLFTHATITCRYDTKERLSPKFWGLPRATDTICRGVFYNGRTKYSDSVFICITDSSSYAAGHAHQQTFDGFATHLPYNVAYLMDYYSLDSIIILIIPLQFCMCTLPQILITYRHFLLGKAISIDAKSNARIVI